MFRIRNLFTMLFVVALAAMGTAFADQNPITPSTNDLNRDSGIKAYFEVVDVGPGYAEFEFINQNNYTSCFEFRSDGDAGQTIDDTNPNEFIGDGLYPYVCLNLSGQMETRDVYAKKYIEVRMVFGSESDDRFDWTRVNVDPKDDCKNGGWEAFGFESQGECIKSANAGQ
jgi:hypothetical protein